MNTKYDVKATVRSLQKEDSYKHLLTLPSPTESDRLEIVEAKLEDKEVWASVLKGCQAVIHCASPKPTQIPRDEMDLVYPALEGTAGIFHTAHTMEINKLILTGDICNVRGARYAANYTEDDWAEIDSKLSPYEKSKILSERCALNFSQEHHKSFETIVLQPGVLLGPTLQDHCNSSSCKFFKSLFDDSHKMMKMQLQVCDVRDAAQAHVNALGCRIEIQQRYIVFNKSEWISKLVTILEEKYGKYGYTFPKKTLGKFYQNLWSWFDSSLKPLMPFYGKEMRFINEKSKRDKIFTDYRPLEKTIEDMAECFRTKGFIEDKVTVFDRDVVEENLIKEKPKMGIGKSVDMEFGTKGNVGGKSFGLGSGLENNELELTGDAIGVTGEFKAVGDIDLNVELQVK